MSQKAKVIGAASLVTLILLAAGLAVTFRLTGSNTCCRDAALKNLSQIRDAKATWSLQNGNVAAEQEGLGYPVTWATAAPIRSLAMTNNTSGLTRH